MFIKYSVMQLALLASTLLLSMAGVKAYKHNYEAKYTKANNVPLWKQRACEKAQKYKANSHYVCDDKGDVKCLPGWQGDLCQVPMCRKSCDPMNGYCQSPGECRCRIGYTGELCNKCIRLPGCQHGDCKTPFECICRPGWDGLFCTEPTCRPGCHNTRGYCEAPGECRCRIGWAGRNCSDCSVLPGCQHGTCTKPLECLCLPGYTGLLCQTAICRADCHKQRGYCKKPGECRCKLGWIGPNCDKCFRYPGCANGDCEKPWECNCKPGWGGILCDEKLTYCEEHPNICENGGKCISLTKEDGSYRCHCKRGYFGKNCEIIDEFLLTSTVAPRITPPPLVWYEEDDEDISLALNDENEVQSTLKGKEEDKDLVKLKKNGTVEAIKGIKAVNMTDSLKIEKVAVNFTETGNLRNVTKFNNTKDSGNLNKKQENLQNFKQQKRQGNLQNNEKQANLQNSTLVKRISNKTEEFISLPTFSDISGSDIVGTGAAVMDLTKKTLNKVSNKFQSPSAEVNTKITGPLASIFPTTLSTKMPISTTTSTTTSPLSKLDEDKNLHTMPLNTLNSSKKPDEEDNDDDDDEECTDDNDDECEYEDEEGDDEDSKQSY